MCGGRIGKEKQKTNRLISKKHAATKSKKGDIE
jgi:hypothetical protein